MKQAQRMQKQMEDATKAIEEKEWEATAGGGAVTVKISGKKEVTQVKLEPEVVDPDDIEMLEDLIMAATNEALRKMEEESAHAMYPGSGPLRLPSSTAGRCGRVPANSCIPHPRRYNPGNGTPPCHPGLLP